MTTWRSLGILGLLVLAACAADSGDASDEDDDVGATGEAISTASGQIGGSNVWAHFVNPDKGRDLTILNEFARLVKSAPPGATVRIGIFNITVDFVAKAIAEAKANKVNVEIVYDAQNAPRTEGAVKILKDALGGDNHFCPAARSGDTGCITTSGTGIMHAKWMTLTKARDPNGVMHSNVSWFGSANLTYATGSDSFNDTITVYDDAKLHDGLVDFFEKAKGERHFGGNDFYDGDTPGRGHYIGGAATAFASPEQQTDLVRARLNDLTPDTRCRIRVAQAELHDSRLALAQQLAAQKRAGCGVYVVAGSIGPNALATLKGAGVAVRSRDHMHSKLVLTAASYGGTFKHVVYTGSHNWTESANSENDELFVRMNDDEALYGAYVRHFNEQFRTAKPL